MPWSGDWLALPCDGTMDYVLVFPMGYVLRKHVFEVITAFPFGRGGSYQGRGTERVPPVQPREFPSGLECSAGSWGRYRI